MLKYRRMEFIRQPATVAADGLIYVSGTVAQDGSGTIVARGDVVAQTRRTIEIIRDMLTEAGSSLDRVVAATVYLTSAANFQEMNAVWSTFWPDAPPTRTTIVSDLVRRDALVEISMVAVPAGAERTIVHPARWSQSPSPYSYAIRTGDTLFLSGLVSRNGRDNSVVGGDVSTQTRVIMDNAGELLDAAGMTHANVVSARVYLTDAATFGEMNAVYRPYFRSNPPARATVRTALAGSEYAVEITMIASSADCQAISSGPSNPNLSAAIRAGNRLYLSGMLGNTPDDAGDAAAQTRATLSHVRDALEAARFTPTDIVEGLVYVTDVGHFQAVDEICRGFFGSSRPARTTVSAGLFAEGAVVEMMFTAFRR